MFNDHSATSELEVIQNPILVCGLYFSAPKEKPRCLSIPEPCVPPAFSLLLSFWIPFQSRPSDVNGWLPDVETNPPLTAARTPFTGKILPHQSVFEFSVSVSLFGSEALQPYLNPQGEVVQIWLASTL